MAAEPPSSFLPPIQTIPSTPPPKLAECIHNLSHIYNPPVRGTRRRRRISTRGASERGPDDNSALRADRFELKYAMTWLTALVSLYSSDADGEGLENSRLLGSASALLALCAGTSSAGILVRTFPFLGGGGSDKVQVTLRDVPLDNGDYASVGAQTWGGACVLGEMLVEDPGRFGLGRADAERDRDHGLGRLRILELGAGTGLVSLVVAKLLQQREGLEFKVVATDYYPSVLSNLSANVAANHLSNDVEVQPLDWTLFPTLPSPLPPPFEDRFDVVFGADVVYEAHHAMCLRSCLHRLLARSAFFYLLFPLRHTHAAESKTVEDLFPFAQNSQTAGLAEGEDILRIYEKEMVVCETDSGEEVLYNYYKIGW